MSDLTPIFSVSEFNEMVNSHLGVLGDLVVEGEISQLKISQGKWVYLTIKDEEASVEVFGMVFRLTNIRSLEEGMLVKVYGKAGIYPKTGRFSIQATQVLPSGEGALKLAYEKLKNQLEGEGLFDLKRKRPLPMFPASIGLITAKGSEAYNDFVKVVTERLGGLNISFYPVSVQGERAVPSILQALEYFNSREPVDVLVLTRGGGSLEDLIAFNDERLVRAIFASHLPTVCAIGHEGDVSLVELAADLRASTPSNAAELVVRERTEIFREIDHALSRLEDKLILKIDQLEQKTSLALSSMSQYLDRSLSQIESTVTAFNNQFAFFAQKIVHLKSDIENLQNNLHTTIQTWLTITLERLTHLEDKLRTLDPKSILKRGFSIMKTKSGKIIRSVDELALGDPFTSILSDGSIQGQVVNKNKGAI
ncbi:MAG: exodeoxyribonuclease VII large subunit [bacterium]